MNIPTTEKEKLFCQYWIEGKSNKEAARLAGYGGENLAQTGCNMRRKFHDYLVAETTQFLKSGGAVAYKTLLDLMEKAENDNTKLKAAIAILEFGGYEPAARKDITITHKSEEEIDAQLKALLNASDVIEKAKAVH